MTTVSGGRFFEDFSVGDVYRSHLGRTITETDNIWFAALTMNTNQIHFNRPYAERTEFGQLLVVSTLSLAIVVGLSVADTSQNAMANLAWRDIRIPQPVFIGDTLWAESEVLSVRDSQSRPTTGIVEVVTRGVNQHGAVVMDFTRTFMVYRRAAAPSADIFPHAPPSG